MLRPTSCVFWVVGSCERPFVAVDLARTPFDTARERSSYFFAAPVAQTISPDVAGWQKRLCFLQSAARQIDLPSRLKRQDVPSSNCEFRKVPQCSAKALLVRRNTTHWSHDNWGRTSDLVSWILKWPLCLADHMISACHLRVTCVSLGFRGGMKWCHLGPWKCHLSLEKVT